jgi:hypothetical protein
VLKTTKMVLTVAVLLSILTGCGQQKNSWVIGQKVSPSQLPAVVVQMVKKESSRFGETNPQIMSVTTDVNDPDQKPMYRIKITGFFVSHGEDANELEMIVLRDGSVGSVDGAWENTVALTDKAFLQEFTMAKIIG